ncbi:MAG: bifunctional phosphoribosylaminoimidazolecarboxamide formyltransferase/IMP cyclohydrolase [Gammaproteobacteria bacterium RIFCSPHIGHO2_12_FULL_35_23]|nr:MAG: bifunctional phosphoribosylaminoimidazolecarboxamide formyltransferase/IMP cyclohydrolase [Gammaproteobacteria bacterium RIFCSPHIGHO2_12_FULL_35_23]
MNTELTPIKTALLSVSNKIGLVEFAEQLHLLGVKIISTGGTGALLQKANIPHQTVEEITQFPEIMEGRVKTLHPKIHGGILGKRDQHADIAKTQQIEWIDLIVCNLYPFVTAIKKNSTLDIALENIDIGGPTLIRAAAKNFPWTTVVIDPNDYKLIINQLSTIQAIDYKIRKRMATKAFAHTAQYDSIIQHYLSEATFPNTLNLNYVKERKLRYGENPHQQACLYRSLGTETGLLTAQQLQGKPMSFNNYVDSDSALQCLQEFSEPACVIVKHANPCGVAIGNNINEAFKAAFEADSKSAFGGIIALNKPCSKAIAEYLSQAFIEIIIAPSFSQEALDLFAIKKNLRLLKLAQIDKIYEPLNFKTIVGGLLMQTHDNHQLDPSHLNIVTKIQPTQAMTTDLLFSWRVVKHIKSNAILIAKNGTTVGIGAGQVSRIDAVEIAVQKAQTALTGTVLASDAFFPFRDSIDRIAKTGVSAIIQPGGSVRDKEVIQACDEYNIAMIFTEVRCFKH